MIFLVQKTLIDSVVQALEHFFHMQGQLELEMVYVFLELYQVVTINIRSRREMIYVILD